MTLFARERSFRVRERVFQGRQSSNNFAPGAQQDNLLGRKVRRHNAGQTKAGGRRREGRKQLEGRRDH